jgi:hypothetical protein
LQLTAAARAGLCPWGNRGKANSWRPPGNADNFASREAKLCNIVTATVRTSRVLKSKAATNNICSNKHKAQREYTYVNTKTHPNWLKPIQPNFKKSFATLFVCK